MSFVPTLVEVAIANALKLYAEAEVKQHELMEAHKLKIDRLEAMIDDNGKELVILKNRIMEEEKKVVVVQTHQL